MGGDTERYPHCGQVEEKDLTGGSLDPEKILARLLTLKYTRALDPKAGDWVECSGDDVATLNRWYGPDPETFSWRRARVSDSPFIAVRVPNIGDGVFYNHDVSLRWEGVEEFLWPKNAVLPLGPMQIHDLFVSSRPSETPEKYSEFYVNYDPIRRNELYAVLSSGYLPSKDSILPPQEEQKSQN